MFRQNKLSSLSLAVVLGAALAAPAHAGTKQPTASAEQPHSQPRLQARSAATRVQPANDMVSSLIVKFKRNAAGASLSRAQAMQQGAERAQRLAPIAAKSGLSISHTRQLSIGADVFKLGRSISVAAAFRLAREMQRNNPDIAYAEPDVINRIMAVPTDPYYSMQWDMYEPAGGMNVERAWNITRGEGAVVAVLDTGVRAHPDLVANLLPGYDFISNDAAGNDGDGRDADPTDPGDDCGQGSSWHGTHVAGTVAAVADNGIGVAGVAPAAKVVPVRVLGKCGGSSGDIIDAMVWASGGTVTGVPDNANPARVLNLSLGSAIPCLNSYREAVAHVSKLGALVVAAAGNESQNVRSAQPASCPGVLAVSATTRAGGRAYYSNYGSLVSLAGPGGETFEASDGILSTFNEGLSEPGADSYYFYQGTSMAAPHIAGLAALMLSVNPRLTSAQLRALMQQTARPFPSACAGCGAGIADAEAAVKAAQAAK
ncbi:S8 family peptidase [Chitinimonas viridis]|uniref:S8 family peptidase n=1 Tax=Chitinimonas viridis TaxID=664880 RepID=A0ABT8B9P1_9NEIS|nr:S8 family peptidase [Chitinimonas viridis]MDN3578868.1 S8 family peptidase [Chitinimonas viridis]